MVKTYTSKINILFIESIISLVFGSLSNYLLISSLTLEIYIFRGVNGLKVLH